MKIFSAATGLPSLAPVFFRGFLGHFSPNRKPKLQTKRKKHLFGGFRKSSILSHTKGSYDYIDYIYMGTEKNTHCFVGLLVYKGFSRDDCISLLLLKN